MAPRRWMLILLLARILLFQCCICSSAKDYTFMHEAISAPAESFYDYIVIGGGTAGCPLAATLSSRPSVTVLVLERGGSPYGNQNIENKANFAASLADDSPHSPSQSFISEDGVLNARARVLGGGSALNAGFYSRASHEYVREAGWDEGLVEQSYQWVERKVAFEPPMLDWQSAVRDGLLEAGVSPYNGFTYEHIYGTKVGGTIFDRQGHRHTSADLLEYAEPTRTTLYLHATVHEILFSTVGKRPRAYGVLYEDSRGGMHGAHLTNNSAGEIILSAGALGSPQILMLSGIGPKDKLKAHGLNVILDQPMVGQGMADNPMNALFIPSPRPVEVSLIEVAGITHFGSYIEAASGSGFGYRAGTEPPIMPPPMTGFVNTTLHGGIILEKVTGPISTGHLELRTADPKDNPSVTFNYFKDPEDLRRCVQGMNTIIDIVNSDALSSFRYNDLPVEALISMMVSSPVNLRPKHPTATISLEQFCIDTVMTIWHYHGGCQIGKVVDRDYRVLGLDGLRVIDGSTFNYSPGTNPQATVMMLGRYMGLKILQDRLSSGS
ncbi:protein HOTHEAD-like [Punica granatum]|uniref:Glucose-methanol-choline oxidoreductase N-terminal domain-containing protein n=2 Tax=Punica granatum TaxID=22663 RepID=A0A218X488_PUNGR|nr:protein HOTHEAD-like [Punica granatum]OWM79500.1 hypothetical protein CDL15_Pgr022912 [Punica granatum]PKI35775.1 hypothetical protein CRG98_043810 [Punica granatum]